MVKSSKKRKLDALKGSKSTKVSKELVHDEKMDALDRALVQGLADDWIENENGNAVFELVGEMNDDKDNGYVGAVDVRIHLDHLRYMIRSILEGEGIDEVAIEFAQKESSTEAKSSSSGDCDDSDQESESSESSPDASSESEDDGKDEEECGNCISDILGPEYIQDKTYLVTWTERDAWNCNFAIDGRAIKDSNVTFAKIKEALGRRNLVIRNCSSSSTSYPRGSGSAIHSHGFVNVTKHQVVFGPLRYV